MDYKVGTFRETGLTAKWSRTRSGAPIIIVSKPNSDIPHERTFWFCDKTMWKNMEEVGVMEGFSSTLLLADIFCI